MNISLIALVVGLVYVGIGLSLAFGGGTVGAAVSRFPRSRIASIGLAAIAIGWTAWRLWFSPLGWFEPYRNSLPWLAVGIWVATVIWVDELLAPRALGGLLLLVAAPVLDAIRWVPTAWRLVLTVQAYVWVVVGMVLVFSPFRFRRVVETIYRVPRRPRRLGVVLVLIGLFMTGLSVTVFRGLPS